MRRFNSSQRWYTKFANSPWLILSMVLFSAFFAFLMAAGLILFSAYGVEAGEPAPAAEVVFITPPSSSEAATSIVLTPAAGEPGTSITVTGEHWLPNDTVFIGLKDPLNETEPPVAAETAVVSEQGNFIVSFKLPAKTYWATVPNLLVTAESQTTGQKVAAEFEVLAVPATASPAQPTATLIPIPTATASPTTTPLPTATPVPTTTPSPTLTPRPVIVDWRGEYWSNRTLSGRPQLVRNDEVVNFDWGRATPAVELPIDTFSARWTQELAFDQGLYRFHVIVDDGARLWVDDWLVVDAWTDGGVREITGEYFLGAGSHTLRLEYYERVGDATIRLRWERADVSSYPDWKAEYWPNRSLSGTPSLTRNARAINFDWRTGSPIPGFPDDDFSVRWSRWLSFEPGVYRFYARADDGIRIYVDNELVLNEWHVSGASRVYTADVSLSDRHRIVVEYFDDFGPALIVLSYGKIRDPAPTPTFPPPTETPLPSPTPAAEQAALNAAISHLASLTGLPRSEIEVVATERTEWPSSQLGCPREDVVGAPVVTPGYLIILAARGQQYEYHTDLDGSLVLCEEPPGPTATPLRTELPPLIPEDPDIRIGGPLEE